MSESPRAPGPIPKPESEPVCRNAGPDRMLTTRGWTLDLCSLAVLGATRRPREHAWPVGNHWQMRTFNRIRSSADVPSAGEEPCRFHYARISKCPDGRWRPVFCTQSGDGAHRFTIGHFYVERGQTNGLVKRGHTAAWAYVHNPFWTEFHMDSGQDICGGPFA
jgi:hypothetical protein